MKLVSMIAVVARYTFIITSLFVAAQVSNNQSVNVINAPYDKQLTILFAGDIMQHGPQINAALVDSTGSYNYFPCFEYVAPIIRSKDVAIANLECTLAGKPYTGYPQFSAPDKLVDAIKDAGFDILATANNHSCDRGDKGIIRTVKVLDSLEIKHTGTFKDSTDYLKNNPLIFTVNDITVALLNYTYGTNGLTFNYPAMVNIVDEQKVIDDINKAKNLNPDFIIVFFHWGNEYERYPTDQQLHLAKVSKENGADAVIGSHPHVIQPFEYVKQTDSTQRNQLVVYSLGNFVSNQRDRYRDGGAMVGFTLLKTWNRKTIIDPKYYLTWVYTPIENNKKQYYILPANISINEADSTLNNDIANRGRKFQLQDYNRIKNISEDDMLKMTIFINDSRNHLNTYPGAIPESVY
ncbi:MAG: CapA family protein [Omnitrophica WOR_2 bacterium]